MTIFHLINPVLLSLIYLNILHTVLLSAFPCGDCFRVWFSAFFFKDLFPLCSVDGEFVDKLENYNLDWQNQNKLENDCVIKKKKKYCFLNNMWFHINKMIKMILTAVFTTLSYQMIYKLKCFISRCEESRFKAFKKKI